MRRTLLWFASAAAVLSFAAPLPAQDNPVKWSFGTPAVQGKASPGALVKVNLTARIEPGWHLYSLKRIEDGPIPTTIRVPEGQPFAIKGEIDAPAPVVQKDPNFDTEVEYYHGEVEFTVPIRVATDAKPGDATLKLTARYQTCNDKLCLPPRVVNLEQPVKIVAK